MNLPRIIRKYPNRRLYDTGAGRYIDLADVRALVAERTEFIVVDKRTGQDITRSVLLQIIAGLEQASSSLMSQSFMINMIRAHGSPRQADLTSALEETAKRFG